MCEFLKDVALNAKMNNNNSYIIFMLISFFLLIELTILKIKIRIIN